jgi:tRNA acetyltransferase TAN1
MKVINAVAKSIPQAHKVDLSNPDKTIIVQIAKVNALIQLDFFRMPIVMFDESALSTKPYSTTIVIKIHISCCSNP